MNYFLYKNNQIVGVTSTNPYPEQAKALGEVDGIKFDNVKDRWDWKSFEEVQELAVQLNALDGKQWLAVDKSEYVSPRYDVMEAPQVGDKVSQAFNGDYYPEGEIVSITKNLQVTTSTGVKFRRRKQSSVWVRVGGTFAMVQGHITEQNPHF